MYHDVRCPYCNDPQDINHDDGYGYQEGVKHNQYCGNCGKTFVYETSISFDYEPSKADCLNDGEHEWKPTSTYPKFLTKMECECCGEERSLTEQERKQYHVPTYEEYLQAEALNANNQQQ